MGWGFGGPPTGWWIFVVFGRDRGLPISDHKGRKQGGRTPIRSSRLDPNAVCRFPQKHKISSKVLPLVVPFSIILGIFFEPFSEKWPRVSRATAQSNKQTRYWIPRMPKWRPRVPKWCPNGIQGCPQGSPRSPNVQKKQQQPIICSRRA